tara:strand:- start:9 stop:305 length:297 start_codon:yes stop_codon:yes gene_type:complete
MKIENLENLANTLEQVCDETFEITGQARHLTVNHILVKLMSLADDNNINIDVELDNVRDCMNKLQSSIFEVHERFKDELSYTKSRIEQIELDNERGVA